MKRKLAEVEVALLEEIEGLFGDTARVSSLRAVRHRPARMPRYARVDRKCGACRHPFADGEEVIAFYRAARWNHEHRICANRPACRKRRAANKAKKRPSPTWEDRVRRLERGVVL